MELGVGMGMGESGRRNEEVEKKGVVIVGGGICGLATALALHKKGIGSLVLERSPEGYAVSSWGSAIGVQGNGWRALHQLGVASSLRKTASLIPLVREVSLDKGKPSRETPFENGEARCLKRTDLINTLASALPPGTIRFGCQVVSLTLGTPTSYPILHLQDGSSIVSKVLIGCDGGNSVIAKVLGLKPTKVFKLSAVRGLTNYPDGHSFPNEFVRMRKQGIAIGRTPITDKLVYWFVALRVSHLDAKVSQNPELIRQTIFESVNSIFPTEITEMIKNSDLRTLSFTHLRYRAPWDLLFERSFRKGTVTVAGDAMHVMGPFLGQGGSAALEDAIVLARHLAQKMNEIDQIIDCKKDETIKKIGDALDGYVKERRMRLVRLSAQTYFTGLLLDEGSSLLAKLISIIFMVVLFGKSFGHSKYDCGKL
ncbi:hypothetical protein LguiB_010332 [Lonicera macranthoides]